MNDDGLHHHALRCACGALRGEVAIARPLGRAVCYCRDCQTYAHALQRGDVILDADGGSDVTPTVQSALRITQGHDALACLSLTERGLLRWYARCCGTPLGNTPRDWRVSYIGLLHTCLARTPADLERVFGPVRARVNTQWAARPIPARRLDGIAFLARLAPRLIRTRFDGSYRRSALFDSTGRPVVAASLLGSAERAQLRSRIERSARGHHL